MLLFIVSGTIVGFVIGLLGGGGSIAAIGSSLVSVDTFGLMTAISYTLSDLVNWWIMFEFVGGGVDSGTVGAWLAARLSKQQCTLHYVFSGVVMLVAIYMLIINAEALDW
ncbi:hypothetical protein AB1K18_27975 [Peribacillus simplex]|uniref:hypothetical protein n=1 Tax=Peribacillus simplex TaxID=1478 RepID=UPI003B8DE38C